MLKPRLRSAPSPTGFFHIGNFRTALFTYLIAKNLGGDFILRIEDTDQKREVEGSSESLIKILEWAGISFDEGPSLNKFKLGGAYGPYIQSKRLEIYKKYQDELLEKKAIYHCFCTPERLTKMREEQQKKNLPPRYDRCCRDLSKDEINERLAKKERFVIRQKMPLKGDVVVNDEIRGKIKFKAEDLDDHILIKSNGIPTYQFANVVDDHEMKITHVTRGEEWIPSFPKNILLYQSFAWQPPKFIHFPVVLNKSGGKLSKRQGDVFVEQYRDKGYLAEALINFCVLLGWHPGGNEEILSIKDLIKKFDYKKISPSPAVFNEEKLDYFNGYYIRQKSLDELLSLIKPFLEKYWQGKEVDFNSFGNDYVKKVISLEQERLKKLSEIGEATEFFFTKDLQYKQDLLIWKKLDLKEVKNNLEEIYEILKDFDEKKWSTKNLEEKIISYIQEKGAKNGDYLWPMRVALTGRKASPGPFEVAGVLGKAKSLERIERAL